MSIIENVRGRLGERYYSYLRWAIVFGVILLSLALPARLPSRFVIPLIILLPAVVAVATLLRWPSLSYPLLVAATMLLPLGTGEGIRTILNVPLLFTGLIAALWVLERITHRKKFILILSRVEKPVMLFAIFSLIAFLMGQLQWFTLSSGAPFHAQLRGFLIYLISFIAFFMISRRIRDLRWLQIMVWLFLAIGGFIVISRFVRSLDSIGVRLSLPLLNGSLFWLWIIVLSASQALFNRRLPNLGRLALGGLLLLTLYFLWFQNRAWSSGWLPAIVGLVVILWVGAPRLGLAATVLLIPFVAIRAQSLVNLVMVGDNNYSLFSRVEAWRIMLEIIKVNPISGVGFANYHFFTPFFPLFGYNSQFNSHNNYIDIIAQTGVLGMICFLWFAVEIGLLAWRLRSRVADGFPKAFVIAALGGLAGMLAAAMMGDWVLPFVYNIGLPGLRASIFGWLFLGGLVVIEQVFLGEKAIIPDSSPS